MDIQSAIDAILDHYEHPRNKGILADASLIGEATNPGCGDVIRITARLDSEGRIAEICFDGEGCTISQAAASMFTEMAVGQPLKLVLAIDHDTLIDALGRNLVIQRTNCVTLALRAAQAAVESGKAR